MMVYEKLGSDKSDLYIGRFNIGKNKTGYVTTITKKNQTFSWRVKQLKTEDYKSVIVDLLTDNDKGVAKEVKRGTASSLNNCFAAVEGYLKKRRQKISAVVEKNSNKKFLY